MSKVSEMSFDQFCNFACEISEPLKNISSDNEIRSGLKNLAQLREKSSKMSIAQMITACTDFICDSIPLLLDKHRADILTVLATANETTCEEVASQNSIAVFKQIKELVKDEEIRELFS